MDFRVLLPIVTYPDATPLEALAGAIELAAKLGATVTAMVHDVEVPPIVYPSVGSVIVVETMSSTAESISHEKGVELLGHLAQMCERSSLSLDVETFKAERPAGETFAARARTFDLTIFAHNPDSLDHASIEQDLLFGSGGPVALVPKGVTRPHFELVAVAWDGGRAAARAVRDALPLLMLARRIEILTCDEDKPIPASTIRALAAFLNSHGIDAGHVSVSLHGAPIGDALQSTAKSRGAGLLVMGAYGHSRLREFILGGATAKALRAPGLPILMSH